LDQKGKTQVVDEVRDAYGRSTIAIVSEYRGLTVDEMTELRTEIRNAGAEIRVVKNTLAKRAAQGTSFEGLGDYLVGPTIIAFSKDPVAPAKALSDFGKKHSNLVVKGGVLDGKDIDVKSINALAKLPSREVLLAKLMGTMNGPIQNFVGVLAAVPGSLVRVLDQVRQQKEQE
jgi:large subunit ribosomal protein L10